MDKYSMAHLSVQYTLTSHFNKITYSHALSCNYPDGQSCAISVMHESVKVQDKSFSSCSRHAQHFSRVYVE